MDADIKTKTPFPQFIHPHPRRHFYWAVFVVVAITTAAFLLIYMQKFKTDEEINSLAPEILHRIKK